MTVFASGAAASDPGPVAHYSFSGNADDDGGHGHNGTIYGGAAFVADRSGNPGGALQFDGQDDYVTVQDNPDMKPQSVSIALWVKVNGDDSRKLGEGDRQWIIFAKNTRPDKYEGYTILYAPYDTYNNTGGRFGGTVSSAGGLQNGAGSVDRAAVGKWYFVVVTADRDYVTMYLDGVQKSRKATGYPLDYSNWPIYFGRTGADWWDGFFNGSIDDLSFYDRVLTPDEVRSLYGYPTATPSATPAPAPSAGLTALGAISAAALLLTRRRL